MKYSLKAYLIHEIGQRANQEDAHYPHSADATGNLFILCDGMGGHSRGEVASNTVCEVMSKSIIAAEKEKGEFAKVMIHNAVTDALHALDALDDPTEERKMGTTMTLLKLHGKGVTIAHIGDSRVYHIRPSRKRQKGEILFRTEDHSLVNQLLRRGQLTLRQALDHPQRHVLTRAMQAGLETPVEADIYQTKDVLPGDIFFMCSDGMLEELYDDDLCAMLVNPDYTDEEKVQVFINFTKSNQDNHTAWIVRVESVETDDGKPIDMVDDNSGKKGFFHKLKNYFGAK